MLINLIGVDQRRAIVSLVRTVDVNTKTMRNRETHRYPLPTFVTPLECSRSGIVVEVGISDVAGKVVVKEVIAKRLATRHLVSHDLVKGGESDSFRSI